MKVIVLVPKVVRNFTAQFPEATQNAYKYFNYDHRVVNERVERGDAKPQYKGAEDLTNGDYDALLGYAKTIVDPILMKYNERVAREDALHMAIRSFNNGMFDGKVNANHFNVLLANFNTGVTAVRKEQKAPSEEDVKLKTKNLKDLGLTKKDVPLLKPSQKGPRIVKDRGQVILKKE
jgi:hypothetical protein